GGRGRIGRGRISATGGECPRIAPSSRSRLECRMQNAKCRTRSGAILHSAFCILHSHHRPVPATTKSGKYVFNCVGASGTTIASLSHTDSHRRQATHLFLSTQASL